MTISNGQLADSEEIISLTGQLFKNQANLIWNSHLVGINSKMNCAAGTLSLNKTFYNSGSSDTSDIAYNIIYDGTNKYWYTPDLSSANLVYADIYATSVNTTTLTSVPNNIYCYKIGNGVWRVYSYKDTSSAKRLAVLLFNNLADGATQPNGVTGLTEIRFSDSAYRNKKVVYGQFTTTTNGSYYRATLSGVDSNTCKMFGYTAVGGGPTGNMGLTLKSPEATTLFTSYASGSGGDTDDYITSANSIYDNITSCDGVRFDCATTDNYSGEGKFILFFSSDKTITKSVSGVVSSSLSSSITTSSSAPDTTTYPIEVSTLIFGDTAASTVTDAIMCYTSSIDATSSLAVTASADGSNYVSATDSNIIDFTNTGTTLNRKFVITRTDLSKTDKIGQEAIIYNVRQ